MHPHAAAEQEENSRPVLAQGEAFLLGEVHDRATPSEVFHLALRQLVQYVYKGEEQLLLWGIFNRCSAIRLWLPNLSAIANMRFTGSPRRGDP